MATQPNLTPAQKAMQTSALLQAVSQLDLLLNNMGTVPDRVRTAAEEFQAALKEWAENG